MKSKQKDFALNKIIKVPAGGQRKKCCHKAFFVPLNKENINRECREPIFKYKFI